MLFPTRNSLVDRAKPTVSHKRMFNPKWSVYTQNIVFSQTMTRNILYYNNNEVLANADLIGGMQ